MSTRATLRMRYPILDYDAYVTDLRAEAIDRTIAIARAHRLGVLSWQGRPAISTEYTPGHHIDVTLHVTSPTPLHATRLIEEESTQ